MTNDIRAVIWALLACYMGVGGTCGGKSFHVGCDNKPLLHVEVP